MRPESRGLPDARSEGGDIRNAVWIKPPQHRIRVFSGFMLCARSIPPGFHDGWNRAGRALHGQNFINGKRKFPQRCNRLQHLHVRFGKLAVFPAVAPFSLGRNQPFLHIETHGALGEPRPFAYLFDFHMQPPFLPLSYILT